MTRNEINLGVFSSTHKNYNNIVRLDKETGLWNTFMVRGTCGIACEIPLEICSISGIGDIIYAGNDSDPNKLRGIAAAYYAGGSYFKNRSVYTKVPDEIDIDHNDGCGKYRYFLHCLKDWFGTWYDEYHEHETKFLHGGKRIHILTTIKDLDMLEILYNHLNDKYFYIDVIDNCGDGNINFLSIIDGYYWRDRAKVSGCTTYFLASTDPSV